MVLNSMIKMKRDICTGAFSCVLAAFMYIAAGSFSGTARFFPRFLAIPIFLIGFLLIQSAVAEKKTDEIVQISKMHWPDYKAVLSMLALLTGYMVLFRYIGFILPTILLIVIGAFLSGYKDWRKSVFAAILLSIGMYFLLTKAFYVRFPGYF